MDAQPTIAQGFIAHTVTWALALPVQVRHELIASAREQARLNRQAQPYIPGPSHFGGAGVWDEIAARIENDGHTPAD